MQFMLVIYNDPAMLDTLPAGEADGMMRDCLTHADELRRDGRLLESRMLEDARRAKTVRIRHGRVTATDGPFAEVKEGARTGSVEVRPVQDIEAVRRRVNRLESPVA